MKAKLNKCSCGKSPIRNTGMLHFIRCISCGASTSVHGNPTSATKEWNKFNTTPKPEAQV